MLKNHAIIENLQLNKRFVRGYRLNACQALTKFVLEIEEKAKKENVNFEIVNCSIHIFDLVINDWTETKVIEKNKILFENYISFIYGDKKYYIEFNENPFFDHYFNSMKIYKDSSGFYYNQNYYLNTFSPFENVYNLYEYSDLAINQIAENLHKNFEKPKTTEYYRNKIRPDKKYIERRIYIW